jgi:spore maturation protein CgeB
MNIIYSYNKKGFEAKFWEKEISAASNGDVNFIPFNHDPYLDVSLYLRAQLLDNLWYKKHPGLLCMYSDLRALMDKFSADALIVDNCFPYHPEFLMTLPIYKVIRTTDGPMAAYDRDFAYLHAYDHVLYHSNAYSPEISMPNKLAYCGAKNMNFLPLGLFDSAFDQLASEKELFGSRRDIDILFVGALHPNKMPLIARVKKAFKNRCITYGYASLKWNFYFNMKYGFPGWFQMIPFEAYVPLYKRAKIGFNVHNRGDYTVGGYRLFELPANGVMQISDGGEYLNDFFHDGTEVVGYQNPDDLIDKISYYLANENERIEIARAGYRRTMLNYRFSSLLLQAATMIKRGMDSKLRNVT